MLRPGMMLLVALLAALLTIQTVAQTSTNIQLILDSNNVVSLYADLVEVRTLTTGLHSGDRVYTFSIDCPPGGSPADDACSSKSIYPAQHHGLGMQSWKRGFRTSGGGRSSIGPSCVKHITAAGGDTTVTTTFLDDCDIETQSIPLIVTAGVDKLDPAWYLTWPWVSYESAHSAQVMSVCGAVSTRTGPSDTPASTTGAATSASETASTITTSAGAGAAGSTQATAKGSPTESHTSASTPSPTGGASAAFKQISWLAVILPAFLCCIV